MRSAQANITIDRPADEVFDYLLDISSRTEFAPTIFRDFRLARVESSGIGAGARFRMHRKLRDRHAGITITETEPGARILEEGSTGRGGRVPMAIEWLIEGQNGGSTKVTWTIETYPANGADKIRDSGLRRFLRNRMPRSLKRMRGILEDAPDASRGERASVGGMDPSYVPNP
jgi:uncharacterized protein YndB with AHSA1/START domain